MFKKITILLCFIASICYTNAQTVTLKGSVKDSVQNSLAYTNIIAKPTDSLENLKFAITGDDGFYKLELKKNSTYNIFVSYLGYKTENFKFEAIQNTIHNIILNEASNKLNEVVIELPVMVKEDTITYNTNKFVTGEERKLKQVLKKLPGVEVDKNGIVTVQGKKITTMLVEGKKFFGGGSKLAVENIPANAVAKIQVLDNYNEVAFLKGLSDSDEMAMNIQLKEDKKHFVFGDVEAGKGNEDFYNAHANLFYYSPKTNLNFIGNLNNTGKKVFTFKDYMSFQGGINAALRGDGSIFNSSASDLAQFMENKDVISSQNQFGAINITSNTTSKLTISGYAIFSNSETNALKEALNSYPVYNEKRVDKKQLDNLLGIGELNLEYAPNLNEQWYFKTQFKKNSLENNTKLTSSINEVTDLVNTNKESQQSYVNQNIEWHKKKSIKHIFSFVADYTYNQNNPFISWKTTQPFLTNWFASNNANYYELYQYKKTDEHNLKTIFKHYWVLNKNNHIYTTLGDNYKSESFFTNDSRLLDDGTTQDLTELGFNNNVNFKLNDLFLGVHYKFITGIFTFKQGLFLHQYNWNVNQKELNEITNSKFVVLPDFLAKIEFSNSEKINIKYNLRSSFSEVSKYANRFYLLSYNSVYKGNELLENELYQSASINYNKFSLYRGLMLFGHINYIKKFNGLNTVVQFEDTNRFLTPIMLNNPENSWRYSLNLKKKIKNIKYGLATNGSTSKYLQTINNNTSTNKSNTIGYTISLKTLFDNFPIIETGFKQNFGSYTSSNQVSKFVTSEPFVTIDYEFLKGFVFAFDYQYYNYQNKDIDQSNKYQLANTSLLYQKEDSAWTFKVDAQNLFDVKYKRGNSFYSYIISDSKTYILPRIIMFSIIYNL